jgi:SAM-dependent methyltransferase
VAGVDIASGLLDAAREKADAEALPIHYRIGDAEDLPFETGAFDAVVSTFGIMFASRPEAAAAELARVCRKGGRIALTTWLSDGNLFKMFEVMKRYMAPPPDRAPRSPFEWGRTERIRELLGNAFQLRFEKAISYYREPSGEAAWDTFLAGSGPTRLLAASLDPERRDTLREDFTSFHAGFSPNSASACRANTG